MRYSLLNSLFIGWFWLQPLQAQVYSWVDETGRIHYSDRAPEHGRATRVELDRQPVTTVGGSGLREAEQALLSRLDQRDRLRAERQAARPVPRTPPPVIIREKPDSYYFTRPFYGRFHSTHHGFPGFNGHGLHAKLHHPHWRFQLQWGPPAGWSRPRLPGHPRHRNSQRHRFKPWR